MNSINSGIDFNSYAIKLERGNHHTPQDGLCIMECVAYIKGEKHSDTPGCADKLTGLYAIRLNDGSPPSFRNRLIKYVFRLAGSRNDELKEQRFYTMMNIAVKKFFPYALKHLGFPALIIALQSLPNIQDNGGIYFVSGKLREFAGLILTEAENLKENRCVRASILRKLSQQMLSVSLSMITYSENSSITFFRNMDGVVFHIVTEKATILSEEEFNLHCEMLEALLSFTDTKEIPEADTKLKELKVISNKELILA